MSGLNFTHPIAAPVAADTQGAAGRFDLIGSFRPQRGLIRNLEISA